MKKLNPIQELQFRYDWKSLLKSVALIAFIACALFVAFNKSYFAMLFNTRNMDGETPGIIYSRNIDEQIIQSAKTGNHIDKELRVKYKYKINGTIYSTRQKVDYAPLVANNINRIRNAKLPLSVTIKYNKEHPEQAIIWLK